MKKILFYILPLLAILTTVSCSDDNEKVAQKYSLQVSLSLPDGYTTENLSSVEVRATNIQTSESFKATAANGAYTVSIPSGEYTVSASAKITNSEKGNALNGFTQNVSVSQNTNVTVTLTEGFYSGLIFKEIYYSKVKKDGKTPYNDEFYELYNNSDEVIYLDNVIFGVLEGSQGVLPTGWMKDGEMMKICALTSYITAFPGNGTDHPLQPGKSVVIATKAMDHKGDPNGCPESPVNLENADWEIYVGEYNQKDIDNPDVPNLNIIKQIASVLVDFQVPYTGNAIIIARLPQGTDLNAFAEDEANLMTNPASSAATKYLIIPQEYVLDGVDIVNTNASKRVKRLRPEVDAGTVHNTEDYCGLSIRRKVQEIKDGRVIYQDTNNSAVDFLTDQVPTPGIQPSAIDN